MTKNLGISITGGTVNAGAMAAGENAVATNEIRQSAAVSLDELREQMAALVDAVRAQAGGARRRRSEHQRRRSSAARTRQGAAQQAILHGAPQVVGSQRCICRLSCRRGHDHRASCRRDLLNLSGRWFSARSAVSCDRVSNGSAPGAVRPTIPSPRQKRPSSRAYRPRCRRQNLDRHSKLLPTGRDGVSLPCSGSPPS